eukprot:CAMPEP_0202045746 /NCGR_PEP_ID=MMETSP0963-20130614/909_1 /ASSEMBLY_ACC=CAM_ASM_000494 /TAXON_ID=4773 /ORGANISM="Schizochytrium aggregatum, Strain ATCC28209" /LENGTH=135 /DNA_ID=CAMNT_0048610361 /DNA_START=134 /DNA_END=536 /DNA_ORIENTATION=-
MTIWLLVGRGGSRATTAARSRPCWNAAWRAERAARGRAAARRSPARRGASPRPRRGCGAPAQSLPRSAGKMRESDAAQQPGQPPGLRLLLALAAAQSRALLAAVGHPPPARQPARSLARPTDVPRSPPRGAVAPR